MHVVVLLLVGLRVAPTRPVCARGIGVARPLTISTVHPSVVRASPISDIAVSLDDASSTTVPSTAAEPAATAPLAETTKRSLVKALTWRLTAAVVTMSTSLFFSGSMRAALGIVGAEFVTKAATMFIGELLWNKSNVGRTDRGDTIGRSLLKAFVWRLFAAFNTLISAGILAGAWDAAAKIAGSDALIKTSLFFVFERVWAAISWGRYQPEKEV